MLGYDFLEAICWIIVVCLCYLELAGLLFFRGGVGCLNCSVFYFLEAPFVSQSLGDFVSQSGNSKDLQGFGTQKLPGVLATVRTTGDHNGGSHKGAPQEETAIANTKTSIKPKWKQNEKMKLF